MDAFELGRTAITWSELPGDSVPVLKVRDGASGELAGDTPTPSPKLDESWFYEVTRIFHGPIAAKQLLLRLGFPSQRMPLFNAANASQFWNEIRDMLETGAVSGVEFDDLLAEAQRQYPGNKIFNQAVESRS